VTQSTKRRPLIATILVLCLAASGFSLQFLPIIEDTIEVAALLGAGHAYGECEAVERQRPDDGVREKGWGGIRCAGYFDSEWKVNKGLMYCRE